MIFKPSHCITAAVLLPQNTMHLACTHSRVWREPVEECSITGFVAAGNSGFLLCRMHQPSLKDGWVYKIPSPVKGPSEWANPEVLFPSGSLDLPNGLVWDMSKRRAYYNDTTGARAASLMPLPAQPCQQTLTRSYGALTPMVRATRWLSALGGRWSATLVLQAAKFTCSPAMSWVRRIPARGARCWT